MNNLIDADKHLKKSLIFGWVLKFGAIKYKLFHVRMWPGVVPSDFSLPVSDCPSLWVPGWTRQKLYPDICLAVTQICWWRKLNLILFESQSTFPDIGIFGSKVRFELSCWSSYLCMGFKQIRSEGISLSSNI